MSKHSLDTPSKWEGKVGRKVGIGAWRCGLGKKEGGGDAMAYRNAGTRCWLKKKAFDLARVEKPSDKTNGWGGGRARLARNRRGGMGLAALDDPEEAEL